MNNQRMLVVLVALLILGGSGAWFALGDDTPTAGTSRELATTQSPVLDAPPLDETTTTRKPAQDPGIQPLPLTDIPARETEPDAEIADDNTSPRETPDTSESPGSSTPRGSTPASAPTTTPKQKRNPTPAEREEARRESTGRPALAERLGRTPGAVSSQNKAAKSPEQEKWDEQWYDEGITPPEMTPTPVHGKIMSQEAREGLASATVALISFFPLDGIAGGALLPVITEFETDKNGFFGGDIPASKLAPLNYPPVAIIISYEQHRIVAGMPVQVLDVGKPNEFGIFWAPEMPYTLKIDATQFDGNLNVVSTGELDPQRWHTAKRADTLAYFPPFVVAKDDPETGQPGLPKGKAELIGTWDSKDAPYVSLLNGTQIAQTRRPGLATIISSTTAPGALPEPFAELVFENDAYTPISGQVLNSEGAGIPNAVITTVGDVLSRTVVTDAAGWFYFEEPPEKTTALHCSHDNYVETQVSPVHPGDSDVTITLAVPRPRVNMFVTDKLTQTPLTDLSVRVIGLHPWGPNVGKPMPEAFTQLTATDGHFVLEWEFAIKSITLERLGYFPKTVADPDAKQDQSAGELKIELSPGRKLEIAPRNFTNAEDTSRWFADPKPEDPGIYTAWSHHWIEYEVDFGDEPEPGEEGGSFDIVLGCTNHGIVDNEYEFKVDVYVDGKKSNTLTIMADSITERTARASLGKLDGVHTIRLIWTNDKWIPNQLDANIRYQSLKFLEQP